MRDCRLLLGDYLPSRSPKVPAPENDTAFGENAQESAVVRGCACDPKETNADVRGSRRLSAGDRGSLLAAPHLAGSERQPKPSLDKVMSQAQIEKKVEDYLRNSQALEDYWQRPITPDQLQAEMERIASHTKQPGVLRELFAALGNDPFVIAECLARPVLAERLITELNNEDRVNLTRIAWREQPSQSWVAKTETQVPVTMATVSANYTLPAISGQSDS